MKKDDFGDRMKAYESAFTSTKISPAEWMAVRIDGRGFSKYTKGCIKPFDWRITNTMIHTTKALVKETKATIGYTQSDEITLLFAPTDGQRIFGGKVSKINSVFASIATAHFNSTIIGVDKLAYFDCRVWSVPSAIEASNVLLWRIQDARKNSVSSLFRWKVGHKEMQNLSGRQMIAKLKDEGIIWEQVVKEFRYGTLVKPVASEQFLTQEELDKIPLAKRPVDVKFTRTKIEEVDVSYFSTSAIEERLSFLL